MTVDEALLRDIALTPRLLVALDFDGTLAPLADEPMSARMAPAAAAAVSALLRAPETTVAFVSGRTLRDLRIIAEHDDASAIRLAGSHGAERWAPGAGADRGADDPAAEALRDRLRAEAEAAVADIEGAWIEPKEFGFGLHTRLVPDRAQAARAQADVDAIIADAAPRWRRRTGHDIVEYAFREEGKDAAVAHLRDALGATAVLFAGDDVTDEDAIRSLRDGDLGIRVGAGESAAAGRAADIAELADALQRLAVLRTAPRE